MSHYEPGSFINLPNKNQLMKLRGAALNVYLAVVDHADADGSCFPSYARLARLTGFSKLSCIKAMEELVSLGLLVKEVRNDDEIGNKSNRYQLVILPMVSSDKEESKVDDFWGTPSEPQDTTPSIVQDTPPSILDYTLTIPSINYTKSLPKGNGTKSVKLINPEVDKVVSHFESKIGKMPRVKLQRFAANTLIKQHTFDRTIGAINAAAACRDHEFAPTISTLEELRDKWVKLETFYRRETNRNNGSVVAI